jgi:hypothetical protein
MNDAFARASAGLASKSKLLAHGGGLGRAPSNWLEYTPYEIYLDLRTAPTGAIGPAAALAETGMYVGQRLFMAYWAGYTAGTLMADLIETYCPGVYPTIGEYLYDSVNAITSAIGWIKTGVAQQNYANWWTRGGTDGLWVGTAGTVETTGGDYGPGGDYGAIYDAAPGGVRCWPFECELH